MSGAAVGIAYLDGPRLRRSLLAAADWVDAGRDELNRINVFPVPDGDTGTNFATTLRAVATRLRSLPDHAPLPTVTREMAEASVLAARGNSGMLFSQFLLGFRDALGDREVASAVEVAGAIRSGANRLSSSLDEPVEGTILTVSREVADAADRAARETPNFEELMRRVLTHGERALAQTPELLEALREAGVVDAGAKAFVRVLEGIMRLIEGDPIVPLATAPAYTVPDAAALAEVAAERDYGFCTEVLVRGDPLPATTEVRRELRPLGGSIVVLSTGDLLKIHVHTNTPDAVFALGARWGTVEATKADDLHAQHRRLHAGHRDVAVVVDSSCDLPDALVDRHGMVVIPLELIEGDRTYQDRLEIAGAEVYRRMREEGAQFTTSQPAPGAFVRAFEDALSGADAAVCVVLAKALSGTYTSGTAAARVVQRNVTVVDSGTTSLGLGLLALKAAELADAGWRADAIAAELRRIRRQSGALFTVDTFDNLLRSGRVGRGRAWLGTLLDVKPILELDVEGRVMPLDRVRGRDALIPRVLRHLDRRLTPRPHILRIGIAHADAPAVAERLRLDIEARFTPDECLVSEVTAVLGVHAGPGAWAIFYQIEDEHPLHEDDHRESGTDRRAAR